MSFHLFDEDEIFFDFNENNKSVNAILTISKQADLNSIDFINLIQNCRDILQFQNIVDILNNYNYVFIDKSNKNLMAIINLLKVFLDDFESSLYLFESDSAEEFGIKSITYNQLKSLVSQEKINCFRGVDLMSIKSLSYYTLKRYLTILNQIINLGETLHFLNYESLNFYKNQVNLVQECMQKKYKIEDHEITFFLYDEILRSKQIKSSFFKLKEVRKVLYEIINVEIDSLKKYRTEVNLLGIFFKEEIQFIISNDGTKKIKIPNQDILINNETIQKMHSIERLFYNLKYYSYYDAFCISEIFNENSSIKKEDIIKYPNLIVFILNQILKFLELKYNNYDTFIEELSKVIFFKENLVLLKNCIENTINIQIKDLLEKLICQMEEYRQY